MDVPTADYPRNDRSRSRMDWIHAYSTTFLTQLQHIFWGARVAQ